MTMKKDFKLSGAGVMLCGYVIYRLIESFRHKSEVRKIAREALDEMNKFPSDCNRTGNNDKE
jgi:hypothetical protein